MSLYRAAFRLVSLSKHRFVLANPIWTRGLAGGKDLADNETVYLRKEKERGNDKMTMEELKGLLRGRD